MSTENPFPEGSIQHAIWSADKTDATLTESELREVIKEITDDLPPLPDFGYVFEDGEWKKLIHSRLFDQAMKDQLNDEHKEI